MYAIGGNYYGISEELKGGIQSEIKEHCTEEVVFQQCL